jgi:hypothetical protein
MPASLVGRRRVAALPVGGALQIATVDRPRIAVVEAGEK